MIDDVLIIITLIGAPSHNVLFFIRRERHNLSPGCFNV